MSMTWTWLTIGTLTRNVKEANFDPEYVEAKGITHAIYAFADIGTNGIVYVSCTSCPGRQNKGDILT